MLHKSRILKIVIISAVTFAGALAFADLAWTAKSQIWYGLSMFLLGVLCTIGSGIFLLDRQVRLLTEAINWLISNIRFSSEDMLLAVGVYQRGSQYILAVGQERDRFLQVDLEHSTVSFCARPDHAAVFINPWIALQVVALYFQYLQQPSFPESADAVLSTNSILEDLD